MQVSEFNTRLQSNFRHSQGYTQKPCLENNNKKNCFISLLVNAHTAVYAYTQTHTHSHKYASTHAKFLYVTASHL